MKLSYATLSDLPEQVERSTYDRKALTPGIVHIGLGNFHRTHQAWYLHKLMQQGCIRLGDYRSRCSSSRQISTRKASGSRLSYNTH